MPDFSNKHKRKAASGSSVASSDLRCRYAQVPFHVLASSSVRRGTALLLLFFSLLGVSCAESSSTQIVVLMDTDYSVPAEVDRLRARISKVVETDAGEEEIQTWLRVFPVSNEATRESEAYALPATFGVLPDESDLEREIVIELEALASGNEDVRVSRRVKTGFVRGEARLVRMLLYRSCAEVTCEEGETCGCPSGTPCTAPTCVDERLPPEDLERIGDPNALPPNVDFPVVGGGEGDAGEPDGSVDDGGGNDCEAPLTICGFDCVDTEDDPRYCGDCTTSCPGGYVCDAGECMDPGDCRTNGIGCSGFTFCDQATGECLRGCTNAQQCNGDHEICDASIHECVCAAEFERCAFDCVDTQNDPRFCGDCATSCPSGDVCEAGTCMDPGDCRTNGSGCSGFTYCDEATGECLRGCDHDDQCTGDNETCDTVTHTCVCAAEFHRCGAVCVSNLDVNTCGDSCTPCSAPLSATAQCNLGVCDFVCDDTYERCDDACCPTICPPGQVLLDGACASKHIQIADDQGNVGEYASLALDATGNPHVGYYSQSGKNLLYATRQANGPWVRETAHAAGEVGQHAALALNDRGVPHVSYYEAIDRNLMVAIRQSNGSWAVQTVDSTGDVGTYTSLAFDPSGVAHISYYDQTNKDLKLAVRQSNGSWAVQTVDSTGDVGTYTSLAFDPSGVAHISYYDQTNKDLKLAVWQSNGSWAVQTVDSTGDIGTYTSVAFDPSGVAHISYYDQTNKNLMLATRQIGGTWSVQTVESEGNVGTYSSLALDANGIPHISYYDETARDLRYAVQVPGGSWKIEIVDSQGDVGLHTSIAVDAEGHSHIGYYDLTNTNLKYALIAGPEE
jgi:hypothetical protein